MVDSQPRELGINDLIASRPRTLQARVARSKQLVAAVAEAGALLASSVFWKLGVRRGDGHSVLVIPGYGAGDIHLTLMRSWLRRIGYRAVKSGLSFNPGWSERIVEELGQRVGDEFARGGRRVTLIGHSLGGLQAHSLARSIPAAIRQVIALGAPLIYAEGTIPPSVAFMSIYSASDLEFRPAARDPHAENIQVRGTHDALVANRRVYRLLADALCRTV